VRFTHRSLDEYRRRSRPGDPLREHSRADLEIVGGHRRCQPRLTPPGSPGGHCDHSTRPAHRPGTAASKWATARRACTTSRDCQRRSVISVARSWITAVLLRFSVRSARRRQERAHRRRWRRRQSRRIRPPPVVSGLPRWPPSGHLEAPVASLPLAARQGPCRGVP